MKIKKKELLLSCWVQTAKCNYYVDGYSGYVADVQYDGYAYKATVTYVRLTTTSPPTRPLTSPLTLPPLTSPPTIKSPRNGPDWKRMQHLLSLSFSWIVNYGYLINEMMKHNFVSRIAFFYSTSNITSLHNFRIANLYNIISVLVLNGPQELSNLISSNVAT